MTFFNELLGIYANPKELANEIKDTEGLSSPIKFFTFVNIITSIILLISSIIEGQTIVMGISTAIGTFIMMYPTIFIASGFIHLIMKLFGDSKKYFQTFKAIAYSLALGILSGLFEIIIFYIPSASFLNYIVALWSLYVMIIILREYSDLSKMKFIFSMMTIITIQIILVLLFIGVLAYFGFLSPTVAS